MTEFTTTGQSGVQEAMVKKSVGCVSASVSTCSSGPMAAPTGVSSRTKRVAEEPSTKVGVKEGWPCEPKCILSTSMMSVKGVERGGVPLSVASMLKAKRCVVTVGSSVTGAGIDAARSPVSITTPELCTVTLACGDRKEKVTREPSGSSAAMGGERTSG